MKVIEVWDTSYNFWIVNTQLKSFEPYKEVYNSDKSKDKIDSSKIMWGIAFLCDIDSKLRQLGFDERKKLIAKDILNAPKFNWKVVEPLIFGWEMFKTSAEKQLMTWERVMNEKTIFMDTMKFDSMENAKDLTKLLLDNEGLYKQYDSIKAKLEQEGDNGRLKGGSVESLLESGEL